MNAGKRDMRAEVTRERILDVAAEEMLRHGFQGASTSEILKKLGISKGALYHHFSSKKKLGYAVLEECFARHHAGMWDRALAADNPLQGVINMLRGITQMVDAAQLEYGCPINNLAQEMSPLDEGFRRRVEKVYAAWERRLTEAFLRAQQDGHMRQDADASEVAAFVIATTQGAIGLAKNAQDAEVFRRSVRGLIRHLGELAVAAA